MFHFKDEMWKIDLVCRIEISALQLTHRILKKY